MILICLCDDFFKDLNSPIDDNDREPLENDLPDLEIEHDLNQEITSDEIKKSIKQLNSGKASGIDCIINEYLKYLIDLMLPVYTKLLL